MKIRNGIESVYMAVSRRSSWARAIVALLAHSAALITKQKEKLHEFGN